MPTKKGEHILIDTREQLPIVFPLSSRTKLDVGDYTSPKHLNRLHIERKSAIDLYGSVLKGHARFRRELKRAEDSGIRLIIVVECHEEVFYSKRWNGARYANVDLEIVRKIINTISLRYNIGFVWCRDRTHMKEVILKLLK